LQTLGLCGLSLGFLLGPRSLEFRPVGPRLTRGLSKLFL
jgi:hypothetical protein